MDIAKKIREKAPYIEVGANTVCFFCGEIENTPHDNSCVWENCQAQSIQNCGNCIYFSREGLPVPLQQSDGNCFRFPPKLQGYQSIHSQTSIFGWCGEWKIK